MVSRLPASLATPARPDGSRNGTHPPACYRAPGRCASDECAPDHLPPAHAGKLLVLSSYARRRWAQKTNGLRKIECRREFRAVKSGAADRHTAAFRANPPVCQPLGNLQQRLALLDENPVPDPFRRAIGVPGANRLKNDLALVHAFMDELDRAAGEAHAVGLHVLPGVVALEGG